MFQNQHGGITSYSFQIFENYNIQAEVISRKGGVSQEPWESLNLGSTVGDSSINVSENLLRVCKAFDLDKRKVFDVWQVHSANVVYADRGRSNTQPHKKADIIISDKPDLTLLMRFADCVPLFIYDPRLNAVGIGHAGWQGTVTNVARAMVKAMVDRFSSKPEELIAAIGPAICQNHYPVGMDVINPVKAIMGKETHTIVNSKNGKMYLDLKKCNEIQFFQAGLRHIENSGICTVCDSENWFSYRNGQGRTGRFGAFIRLIGSQ